MYSAAASFVAQTYSICKVFYTANPLGLRGPRGSRQRRKTYLFNAATLAARRLHLTFKEAFPMEVPSSIRVLPIQEFLFL